MLILYEMRVKSHFLLTKILLRNQQKFTRFIAKKHKIVEIVMFR